MFEINATLPVFVLSFLLFLYLFNQWMLKPVGKVIEERERRVQADLQAGKEARVKAEGDLAHYEEQLRKIRQEAQAIINGSLEKAGKDRAAQLDAVRLEGQRRLNEAKSAIASERAHLVNGLIAQETELVQSIVHKLLGEPVSVGLEPERVRSALEEAC